jgi:pyruvate dehydrogenase E1 component
MHHTVLGTDGFGRSAPRQPAKAFRGRPLPRRQAGIAALATEGKMTAKDVAPVIMLYKIDAEKPNPVGV